MTSARRLYRLQLGVSAAGLLVALLSLGVALRALDFSTPRPGVLVEACGSLLPQAGAFALLVLPLAALGLSVVVLAGRSALRQLAASRRFVAGLRVVRTERQGEVLVFDDRHPQAFCAGILHPRVYISTAAAALPDDHRRAVLAHERHHQRRHDPLRILLARMLSDALFFVPELRRLTDRYRSLAEVAADEAALREHDRETLAGALLAFGETSNTGVVVGIAPERVDCLLGSRPRWDLRVSALLRSGAALAALAALALGALALTAGGELNVPLLLAQSCMLLMFGLPLTLVGVAFILARAPRVRVR